MDNPINITTGIFASVFGMFPVAFIASTYTLVSGAGFSDAVGVFLMWSFWGLVVSFLAAIVYGTPIFLLLHVLGWDKLPVLISFGGIGGYFICFWLFPSVSWVTNIIFIGLGGYCAFTYWYGAKNLK